MIVEYAALYGEMNNSGGGKRTANALAPGQLESPQSQVKDLAENSRSLAEQITAYRERVAQLKSTAEAINVIARRIVARTTLRAARTLSVLGRDRLKE